MDISKRMVIPNRFGTILPDGYVQHLPPDEEWMLVRTALAQELRPRSYGGVGADRERVRLAMELISLVDA